MVVLSVLLALLQPADLKPGLVADYADGTLVRVEPKPAFSSGGASPHPRVPSGPLAVRWSGLLHLQEDDEIRFFAEGGGRVTVTVGGEDVLGRAVPLESGRHPLVVEFRSVAGVPARLQLWWEGVKFLREPLPAWRLFHRESPDDRIGRGREAVARLGCARCHPGAFPGVRDPAPGPSLSAVSASPEWMAAWLGRKSPRLFDDDRTGQVERWIVAREIGTERDTRPLGDHRMGKRHFLSIGCIACHLAPDEEADPLGRKPFAGLGDRWTHPSLSAFLRNPGARYPDGRMPAQPLSEKESNDLAAYLLLWFQPTRPAPPPPPTDAEIGAVARRLGVGVAEAGRALLREKRCGACHDGTEGRFDVDVRPGAECAGPEFRLDAETKADLAAYLRVAAAETHASPVHERRRMLKRLGCVRCHARDQGRRPPPLEEASSELGGAYLQTVPFLRTPRLSYPLTKYRRDYVLGALRDGVSGVRHGRFTFRMPKFGDRAEEILRALAEADGDDPDAVDSPVKAADDPTLAPLGPALVGFEGYSCISCHVWKGKRFSEADPGAVGPELTSVTRRIRRAWFDRWLEDPARILPGTPMPQIFPHGKPAKLAALLDGDASRQREALWAYLAKGKQAPSPKPKSPLAIRGPLVAQIPLRLPDNALVEALVVISEDHDLAVIDLGAGGLRALFVGAQLLRHEKGRIRTYTVSGTPVPVEPVKRAFTFAGYDRVPGGARIRWREGEDLAAFEGRRFGKIPLPPAEEPEPVERRPLADEGPKEGALVRPGYRAVPMERPKTASGEDLVMPSAIAVHPRDGRVFVASMKRGEIFVLRDGRYEDYAGGLFQEAYSMKCESDALTVLHRRNLTRITDTDGDGTADRFDRVVHLAEQQVGEAYDYGYGLTRDRDGAFVWSHAPHANRKIRGSGGALRLVGGKIEEVAWGFRNPLGWCEGPGGGIYFTDNQGEWVATNKLCHVVPGRFYDYPNREQPQHRETPRGRAAVWVPYAWARSINGVTFDATGGGFGPFDGQFFLAELMYGGALIRACVEEVNGEVQGACFPFWGKGLLGPVVLAFDPKGPLWVGSITEPGWMAQPDRGAVYRIEYTGEIPFEMKSLHARPRGFRVVFTKPVDPASAVPGAFAVEHWRYELTGAYGSPELDRTSVPVRSVTVAADGRSAELDLGGLVRERVYRIAAEGVRSREGGRLVHPEGAYTLNEIPR